MFLACVQIRIKRVLICWQWLLGGEKNNKYIWNNLFLQSCFFFSSLEQEEKVLPMSMCPHVCNYLNNAQEKRRKKDFGPNSYFLPYYQQEVGSNPNCGHWLCCVQLVCSLRIRMDSLRVLWLPPADQRHAFVASWNWQLQVKPEQTWVWLVVCPCFKPCLNVEADERALPWHLRMVQHLGTRGRYYTSCESQWHSSKVGTFSSSGWLITVISLNLSIFICLKPEACTT